MSFSKKEKKKKKRKEKEKQDKANKLKGALSDLRQYLATESPLKMMKNAFYFTLKVLFVLKITACLTNNRNTHTAQYLEK